MTKIFDSNISKDAAFAQYNSALRAVIDRALSKAEIYTNTVGDQFLYVAATTMLDHPKCRIQGVLQAWCDESIAEIEHQYALVREMIDILSGKDDDE